MKPDDGAGEVDRGGEHPTAAELAAFVDGALTVADRSRVETHLVGCPSCREDVRVVTEAIQDARPSRRPWLTGTATAAAAVAAAVVLLLLVPGLGDESPDAVLRGPGGADGAGEVAAALTVVSPAPGGTVSAENPRFVWRSAGPDAQYRFHIATEAGDPVATVTTGDTVVASLGDDRLSPGTTYYWWVDALRSDGSSVETGPHRVAAVP